MIIEKCYDRFGFACYKMTKDGKEYFVPLDEANSDYQAIQEWISEGNTVIDNGN